MVTDPDDRAVCRRLETRLFCVNDMAETVNLANRFIGERPAVIYTHSDESGPYMMEVHVVGYAESVDVGGPAFDDKSGVTNEVH